MAMGLWLYQVGNSSSVRSLKLSILGHGCHLDRWPFKGWTWMLFSVHCTLNSSCKIPYQMWRNGASITCFWGQNKIEKINNNNNGSMAWPVVASTAWDSQDRPPRPAPAGSARAASGQRSPGTQTPAPIATTTLLLYTLLSARRLM